MRLPIHSIFIIAIALFFMHVGLIPAEEEKQSIALPDSVTAAHNTNLDTPDSTSNPIDSSSDTTISTINIIDSTLDTTVSSLKIDDSTLAVIDSTPIVDSTGFTADSTGFAEDSAIDTSYRVWNSPFWSFGIGWGLGSMPVFDSWKSGLPYDFSKIPEVADTLDSLNLLLSVNNEPGSYNVNFPLSLSFTPFIGEESYLSLKLTLSWLHKRFEAVAITDSGIVFWATERNLSLASFSLGLFFNRSIPAKLFHISKTEKVSFTFGFSGEPVVLLQNSTKIKNKPKYDNTSYGIGVSWYIGLSTLRPLSQPNGLEVGTLYKGSWNGRFMHDDHHIKRGNINQFDKDHSEVLQFFSHRFILYFNILAGEKVHTKKAKNSIQSNSDELQKE